MEQFNHMAKPDRSLDMEQVPGAVTLSGRDFTKQETWTEIRNIVGDRNIDIVLRSAGLLSLA